MTITMIAFPTLRVILTVTTSTKHSTATIVAIATKAIKSETIT